MNKKFGSPSLTCVCDLENIKISNKFNDVY